MTETETAEVQNDWIYDQIKRGEPLDELEVRYWLDDEYRRTPKPSLPSPEQLAQGETLEQTINALERAALMVKAISGDTQATLQVISAERQKTGLVSSFSADYDTSIPEEAQKRADVENTFASWKATEVSYVAGLKDGSIPTRTYKLGRVS